MLSRLREHLGSAGLIVAIVALVAALGGGAIAATGGSGDSKATASAKGKQGPRGKTGKTGPAGPAGPTGAKGDTGAAGANGSDGTNGTDGSGPAGTSFSGSKTVESVTCTEGGTEYKGATTNLVCNGKKGANGTDGEPWTMGGTLPPGATETGTFGGDAEKTVYQESEAGKLEKKVGFAVGIMPISFTVPLEAAPTPTYLKAGETSTTDCPGIVAGVPTAEPGHLCVYAAVESGNYLTEAEDAPPKFLDPVKFFTPGVALSGTAISFVCKTEECFAYGSWAVTAAE